MRSHGRDKLLVFVTMVCFSSFKCDKNWYWFLWYIYIDFGEQMLCWELDDYFVNEEVAWIQFHIYFANKLSVLW